MIDIKKYFADFTNIPKHPSLDTMKYFCDRYGNFEKQMKFLHIAGTNGKGSCCEILSKILINQGYKVGKFMSPHLIKYNERISINNVNISDLDFSNLIEELQPEIISYPKKVTLFEIETIIALLYFYRNNIDFIILETGLGGLYDSTNIISRPLVSIITSISYDHTDILGKTLKEIAIQKSGIIKKNSHTVFFSQSTEINNVIKNKCETENNTLHLITENQIKNYSFDENFQYFDYDDMKEIALNLKGKNQIKNVCLCLECMKILNQLSFQISEINIKSALASIIHKGRMEILHKNPLIIFDGAHNPDAIKNLLATIDMYYKNFKRQYVISILRQKDYESIIKILLSDQYATFILTDGNDEKIYTPAKKLFFVAQKYKSKNQIICMKKLDDAIDFITQNKNDSINFVIGSFYVYNSVINKLQNQIYI